MPAFDGGFTQTESVIMALFLMKSHKLNMPFFKAFFLAATTVAWLLMAGCSSSSSSTPAAGPSGDPQAKGGWEDTKIPSDIQTPWTGSIDIINGKPAPTGNSMANPMSVPLGQKLEIAGWATSEVKNGDVFDAVYAVIGKRQLRGVPAARPDVVTYTHNSKLSQSGFQISIDTSTLEKRDYTLRLVGVSQNGSYYRSPAPIFIRIE
jgi:hypothetical protein